MSGRGRKLSDAGWGILILLFIGLCSIAEWTFLLTLVVLCTWMWSRYKRTGQVPDVGRMIDDLFTKDRRRRR